MDIQPASRFARAVIVAVSSHGLIRENTSPHDMRRGDISGMPELPIFLGAAPQCLPFFRKMPENVYSAFRGFEPINTKIQ